jgi:SAM-dependent methyltransferase
MNQTLPDLYLKFTFDLVATAAFEHLHWGLFDGLPHDPAFLPQAQQLYAERLLSLLPDTAARVLDVGCGLGGLSRMVVERGARVVALSPRRDHIDLIRAAGVEGLDAECGTFETFEPTDAPFDALLFSESFNFFVSQRPGQAATSLAAFAERCAAHTRVGSVLLIADIVSAEVDAGVRVLPGFRVEQDLDVHEHATYSATALQAVLERSARPYHELLMGVLALQAPDLHEQVAEVLRAVPNVPLQQLFSGRMVEFDLAQDRRYRMYRLRRVA